VLKPMIRAGGALGRLLPCDELPWPLLPAAAAALVDGTPPAPPLPAVALPLPLRCETSHAPSTSCSERGGAHPCDRNAASLNTQLKA
jgi:hypothetical protein